MDTHPTSVQSAQLRIEFSGILHLLGHRKVAWDDTDPWGQRLLAASHQFMID